MSVGRPGRGGMALSDDQYSLLTFSCSWRSGVWTGAAPKPATGAGPVRTRRGEEAGVRVPSQRGYRAHTEMQKSPSATRYRVGIEAPVPPRSAGYAHMPDSGNGRTSAARFHG